MFIDLLLQMRPEVDPLRVPRERGWARVDGLDPDTDRTLAVRIGHRSDADFPVFGRPRLPDHPKGQEPEDPIGDLDEGDQGDPGEEAHSAAESRYLGRNLF